MYYLIHAKFNHRALHSNDSLPLGKVDVYILDSGIDIYHPDFEGRVKWGWPLKGFRRDVFGHGTHVAGLVGSKTFGVARNANLIAVRVLDDFGMGSTTDIINGIQYILEADKQNPSRKSIINISFSGPKDTVLDHLLRLAISKGILVVVAAGNDGLNACDFSPSRLPMVITVGALNNQKLKASFSNYGSCVNIWALGVSVESLWPNDQTHRLDGTSTSAPRVVGHLVLLWNEHPHLSRSALFKLMYSNAVIIHNGAIV